MSTPEPTPDLVPAGSFRDQVRAARAAALARNVKELEIPGFEGTIWGTFRALDKYADTKQIVNLYAHLPEDEQELMVMAETIQRSCVGLFGMVNGVKAPLDPPDMRLGARFAEWVEEGSTATPDGIPMTDLQALISVIIPNEIHRFLLHAKLEGFTAGVAPVVDKEQVGNSAAPS